MRTAELDFPIGIVQLQGAPGNIRQRLGLILDYMDQARAQGVRLIVFEELATSGYLLGDRWENDAFIREIKAANDTICRASRGLTVVWGSVVADATKIGEDGRTRKYNAALIAHDGAMVSNGVLPGWVPKTNHPKYRIFDDERHFYPAAKLAAEMEVSLEQLLRAFEVTVDGRRVRLALVVCEDSWDVEYATKPARIYAAQDLDLFINISKSPWTPQKWRARNVMLTRSARSVKCPMFYVNGVGLENTGKNLVWFDGASAAVGPDGAFVWRAPQHQAGLFLYRPGAVDASTSEALVSGPQGIKEIYDAMIPAMREFFGPFPRVIIGLSGGIDSAVAAALLVDALGASRVLAVNMPTPFNSQTTRELAAACASALGIEYLVAPIGPLYEQQLELLRSLGYQTPSKLVRENIQAGIRGQVLARVSACNNGVFVCNGNKTEVSFNYFTLYGDGAGAAAFLADLWKGQIYELARYLNKLHGTEVVPQGIIDIVPSAELSADQNVDEGKGDPIFYDYHDYLLSMFIERRWDISTVLEHVLAGDLEVRIGCEPGTVARRFATREAFIADLEWAWRQFNIEFKRVQLPPVFVASRRAFGNDRRETIADAYFTDAYYRLRELYLAQTLSPA